MENKASAAQEAAIRHRDGPALVIAGPGSGKTYTLTHRLMYLTGECSVMPDNILIITFTNAAAAEMKKRASSLIPGKASYMTFGTFHSVFFLILKHTFGLTSANILKNEQRYAIINDGIKKSGIRTADKTALINDLTLTFSSCKNSGRLNNKTELTDEEVLSLMEFYNNRLKEMRLLDFDDMLLKCRELFIKKPQILEIFKDRFRYILIDEFQDINSIQYEVVKLLAGDKANLFAVGDDDQSVYAFRGSVPETMKTFLEDYPEAKKYELLTNYRSKGCIVEAAGKVIGFNKNRIVKDISAFDMTKGELNILGFKDRKEELDHMASYIKDGLKTGGYEDFAIFVRTNSMVSLFEEGLKARGIKCTVKGRVNSIYTSAVGRDILDYMRFVTGDDSRRTFTAIMNKPERHILRWTLTEDTVDPDKLLSLHHDELRIREGIKKLINDRRMMSRLRPELAVHYLLNMTGYLGYLKALSGKDSEKFEIYKENAFEIMERAASYGDIREWIKAAEEMDEAASKNAQENEGVPIMTMHASKGLEFKKVIIADTIEGIIPYSKAVHISELEEERRLFYVAMTRAQRELNILYIAEDRGRKTEKSRFVAEIL
ncbi:MAG: ATP-dependent helicase [Lachnospiraceae bacterium]|nr:ATP-dependent helicase [Lachnospiraceae bacterium]